MKRRMDIEDAVRWAYRDELPKDQARVAPPGAVGLPWKRISNVGYLGTVIDDMADLWNRYGVCPFPDADTLPHPDAVRIHEAVVALDDLELGMPEDWEPLADLAMDDTDRAAAVTRAAGRLQFVDGKGRVKLRQAPRMLVQRAAVLGPPDWQAETPVRREVTDVTGRAKWFRRVTIPVGLDGHPYEIEVDGWCATKRRPHADAYRKFVFEPDPAEIAVDRAAYEVWRAALDVLALELADRLDSMAVTPSARPWRPWEEGASGPRIWERTKSA